MTPSDSRAMVERETLQMENRGRPLRFAPASPRGVRVSPDWEMATHNVPYSTTGSRYRTPTRVHLDGNPRQPLDHELPDEGRMPGCAAGDEGHLLHGYELFDGKRQRFEKTPRLRPHPAREGVEDRPRLFMDLLQHEVAVTPFSAIEEDQSIRCGACSRGFPKVVMQPRRRATTISPSSRKSTSRVWDKTPSGRRRGRTPPLPSDDQRAVQARPTQRPRLPVGHREEGVRPQSSATVLAHRLLERHPRRDVLVQKMGDHSVSVSEQKVRPFAIIFCLSVRWFSTIPLWITATWPARCGFAFSSEGRPWVAHRVAPTPHVPEPAPSRFARQAGDLPLGLADGDPAAGLDRDPRRIVPAVLQPPQPSTRISTQELGPV